MVQNSYTYTHSFALSLIYRQLNTGKEYVGIHCIILIFPNLDKIKN